MQNKSVTSVNKGVTVKAGQLIGYVGKMDGVKDTMLHFEMYAGNAAGPLTNRENPPYLRRSDILDPTDCLDKMVTKNAQ